MERTKRKEVPRPHSKELKILTTCAVLFGNITFGCAMNFYSPSLEELRRKYDTTVDEISIVFTVMGICFCIGALASGFLYNWFNRQVGSIICLGGIALAMTLTPHCPSITILFINCAFLGLCIGAYDTAQIVWMIEIWQSKSGPWIQAQNFCFALGTNVPQLLLAPFLPNRQHGLVENFFETDNSTNNFTSFEEDDLIIIPDLNSPIPKNQTENYSTEESLIYIPFGLCGLLNAIAMAAQIYLFIFYRYYTPPLEEEIEDSDDSPDAFFISSINNHRKRRGSSISNYSLSHAQSIAICKAESETGENTAVFNWARYRLIIVSALFIGAYCGMEVSCMQFLPTFAQYSELKLSEVDSAFVLAGLTGAFAVGRALGICIVMKIPPVPMLIGNFTLIIIGNLILLFWASSSYTMLWVACVILGAGFSTVFASFCGFMERHLLFTNAIGSCLIVTASVFTSTYPLIVGRFVEENVVVLSYTNFLSIVLCLIALATAYVFTYKNTARVG